MIKRIDVRYRGCTYRVIYTDADGISAIHYTHRHHTRRGGWYRTPCTLHHGTERHARVVAAFNRHLAKEGII